MTRHSLCHSLLGQVLAGCAEHLWLGWHALPLSWNVVRSYWNAVKSYWNVVVKLKCGQVILKCNQITLKCTQGILKCGQVSTKMWSSHTEMWLGHTEMCSGNTEMQLGQTECGQVIPKCDGEVMLIHTMCLVSYCKWWAVRICTVYVASLHWYGYGLSWPLLILWLPYYSVYNNINGGTFGGEGVGSI